MIIRVSVPYTDRLGRLASSVGHDLPFGYANHGSTKRTFPPQDNVAGDTALTADPVGLLDQMGTEWTDPMYLND